MQGVGVHVPNLVRSVREDSDVCHTFYGLDCSEAFFDWLEAQSQTDDPDVFRKLIVVFHNFKGCDSQFVLQALYKRGMQNRIRSQICAVAKVLSLSVGEALKFIDSFCFLPMTLSAFPKTFGLRELTKGFFPRFFNTPENQDYVG